MTESVEGMSQPPSTDIPDIPLEEIEIKLLDSIFSDAIEKIRSFKELQARIQNMNNEYQNAQADLIASSKSTNALLHTILKNKGIEDPSKYIYDLETKKIVLIPTK